MKWDIRLNIYRKLTSIYCDSRVYYVNILSGENPGIFSVDAIGADIYQWTLWN
jgi:hypothetical protein